MYYIRFTNLSNETHWQTFDDAEDAFYEAQKKARHFAIKEVRVYEEDNNGNLILHVVYEPQIYLTGGQS